MKSTNVHGIVLSAAKRAGMRYPVSPVFAFQEGAVSGPVAPSVGEILNFQLYEPHVTYLMTPLWLIVPLSMDTLSYWVPLTWTTGGRLAPYSVNPVRHRGL